MNLNGWLLCNDSPLPPEPPYKMSCITEYSDSVTVVTYHLYEGDPRGSHIVCRYISPTRINVVVEDVTKDEDCYRVVRDTGYRRVFYGAAETSA